MVETLDDEIVELLLDVEYTHLVPDPVPAQYGRRSGSTPPAAQPPSSLLTHTWPPPVRPLLALDAHLAPACPPVLHVDMRAHVYIHFTG